MVDKPLHPVSLKSLINLLAQSDAGELERLKAMVHADNDGKQDL